MKNRRKPKSLSKPSNPTDNQPIYVSEPIGPDSFPGSDFPDAVTNDLWDQIKEWSSKPLVTLEEEKAIKEAYVSVKAQEKEEYNKKITAVQLEKSWIQTYTGKKFYPLNPYIDAIVIEDIAHPLSMQCRFSGHVNKFYSVAQHSVLVSYLCDSQDALWGLLHDASEAYLVDVPRPLKQSGKFGAYIEFEKVMQEAICKRFNLPLVEPPSVKKADTILLATEARDLMAPLHTDWKNSVDPLPFKIEPLLPQEAKNLFMKRFFELTNSPSGYEHYLSYENEVI